jgi:hypothetical protein
MALWPRMRPESRWIGGDADGGGELVAADGAEFGQFGKESAHGDVADAGNGFQERLGLAPDWGSLDGLADVAVDLVEFLFQERDMTDELLARCLSEARRRRLASMPIISIICRRLPTSSAKRPLSGSGRGPCLRSHLNRAAPLEPVIATAPGLNQTIPWETRFLGTRVGGGL